MSYSPISSMRIKNFRNIGDIEIDFTESPIITLIGENEAGKTSIVKAFCVAGLNAFSKKQKNYIKEGTNGFGVNISLSDGTSITRIKTNASNQLTIDKANGERWSASKLDSGIPVELQAVMGLVEEAETKELIHVRTYEDQLLFVVTSGSTNYKVMYDALKVDQLTRALKLGTEQANALKRSIDSNQLVVKALMDNIRQIRLYDIEPVVNIKDRIKQQLGKLAGLEKAIGISESIEKMHLELGAIDLIARNNVQEISTDHATLIDSVGRALRTHMELSDNLSRYNSIASVEEVNTSVLDSLLRAIQLKNNIEAQEKQLGAMGDLDGAEEIDASQLIKFRSAIEALRTAKICEQEISRADTSGALEIKNTAVEKIAKLVQAIQKKYDTYEASREFTEYENKRKELNQLLKDSGAVVAECPKCGEAVVIDARAYSEA